MRSVVILNFHVSLPDAHPEKDLVTHKQSNHKLGYYTMEQSIHVEDEEMYPCKHLLMFKHQQLQIYVTSKPWDKIQKETNPKLLRLHTQYKAV